MDLSRPEEQCTKSLEKWLLHIANFSKTHHDSTGAANTAKDSLLHYLQHAKHFKIMPDISSIVSSDLSSEASSEISSLKMNLGFPIIVVGCKADLIGSQNDSGDINNAKEIQGRIRALSLQFGAALVYTSAEKATNIVNLRKYMYHRLYPEVIPSNLVIEV